MSALVECVVREAQEHIDLERKAVLDAKVLADNVAHEEIRRLQNQNAFLVRLLQNEKAKSELAKDELIKRISGLLGEFVNERDQGLREAVSHATESNDQGDEAMARFQEEHVHYVEGVVTRGQEWYISMDKKGGEGKRLRDGALKVTSFLC